MILDNMLSIGNHAYHVFQIEDFMTVVFQMRASWLLCLWWEFHDRSISNWLFRIRILRGDLLVSNVMKRCFPGRMP